MWQQAGLLQELTQVECCQSAEMLTTAAETSKAAAIKVLVNSALFTQYRRIDGSSPVHSNRCVRKHVHARRHKARSHAFPCKVRA